MGVSMTHDDVSTLGQVLTRRKRGVQTEISYSYNVVTLSLCGSPMVLMELVNNSERLCQWLPVRCLRLMHHSMTLDSNAFAYLRS